MFYWREIQNGKLKFNRRDAEVPYECNTFTLALKLLTQLLGGIVLWLGGSAERAKKGRVDRFL